MSEEEQFDFEATVKEINRLQQGNIDKVKALAQLGRNIDPGSVANIKIDTLVEFLDKNTQARYVLAMEKALRAALDQALSEVRQASLVQGVQQQAGKLIVP